MIAMRPIREYDVIDLLNNGRFEGEVEGYVVMDGPKYLGHMLYRVDGAVTQVLECAVFSILANNFTEIITETLVIDLSK